MNKQLFTIFKCAVRLRRQLTTSSVLGAAFDNFFRRLGLDRVRVRGMNMHVNPLDSGLAWPLIRRGVYEKFETALFARMLKPGMSVLDIGANIGYYTLLAAQAVGPSGRVVALEPEPGNFRLLEKNLLKNSLQNVELVRKAAADSVGIAELFLHSSNLGDHRMSDLDGTRKSIVVRTIAIDDLVGPEATFDVIKLDVQGAERLVLKGMKGLVKRSKRLCLLTEFWPYMLDRRKGAQEYWNELQAFNFRIFLIDERNNHIFPTDFESVLNSCPEKKHANLLCIKP